MGEIASFRLGSPNLDLVPLGPLVEAARKLLRDNQSSSLSYGEVQGDSDLRRDILARFAFYYPGCDPDRMILTHGVSEAISLVARATLKQGDSVIVESPTYYWALPEFAAQGANIIQMPTDRHGFTRRPGRGPPRQADLFDADFS
jgi:2-aminoadipate transaminase